MCADSPDAGTARESLARPTGVGRAITTYTLPIEGRDEWLAAARRQACDAAELVDIRPSTVKRHLADLRARSGLTTEQLIYAGRASGRLVVPSLEPH